jgi:CheY-like chemotaxis protein
MPHMDGFELCEKILELDINIRVCFISAAEVNIQALRSICKSKKYRMFYKKTSYDKLFSQKT